MSLVRRLGASVAGCAVLLELDTMGGRKALEGVPFFTVPRVYLERGVKFREGKEKHAGFRLSVPIPIRAYCRDTAPPLMGSTDGGAFSKKRLIFS